MGYVLGLWFVLFCFVLAEGRETAGAVAAILF